ncbi:hypothetical protein OHA37_14250 [Streptomyces sp. NBC_00335]|uniref:hypothetical protein n=1 Tax=unclassified Streptomyces TaxID=2593676 RepID=UPI0022563360|nr:MULTISPECIES: hypothetical protein [unclassified Streptomyces]MCX5405043.1 hypothetical protein [Streptomyces sp. NBC_00086]
MKHTAAKTLGVAALGAAFAAVAAGSASAVPAVGLSDALGTVTGAVQGATSQQHVAAEEGQQASDASDPAAVLGPVTGLLGGLPTSGLGA